MRKRDPGHPWCLYLGLAFAFMLAFSWYIASRQTPRSPPQEPSAAVCREQAFSRYVRVERDSIQLQDAIEDAEPGTLIEVMPGVYRRPFKFNLTVYQKHAEPGRRIIICGAPGAWVSCEGPFSENPYNFLIQESSFISLVGFTIHKGLKGLVIDGSTGIEVRNVTLQEIDQEAISLRHGTTHTLIQDCIIKNTGRKDPGFGEGIYVGSSARFGVDMCINTTIVGNHIGPGVTAECIDVKENTQGGVIRGNVFDGSGMAGEHFGDSWVDMKGTKWVVEGNSGVHPIKDGFQVHAMNGFDSGQYNTFSKNTCEMGDSQGECFHIRCRGKPYGCHNVIKCDNVVLNQAGVTLPPHNCTA